jgi:hypothetical protein
VRIELTGTFINAGTILLGMALVGIVSLVR